MRVAAGDIGTNSTRLLVAEVSAGRVVPLQRHVVVTGLGAGVDREGRLGDAGMARTLEVLAGYRSVAEQAGARALRMVGTAALRAATGNGEEFLARAEAVLRVRPEVIGGEEEAVLGFEGAVGGISGTPPFLVIDVGGGSTEFVFGTTRPEAVESIDLGSRRMTERYLSHHPCRPGELAEARRVAAAVFDTLALPGLPGTVVGVGGTYTSQAALELGLEAYDSDRVHGSVVSLTALDALAERLAGMTLEEIAALPSLDPARAPVLPGGAVLSAEALRCSGRGEIVVSEADLLDGIARRLAALE